MVLVCCLASAAAACAVLFGSRDAAGATVLALVSCVRGLLAAGVVLVGLHCTHVFVVLPQCLGVS